MSQKNEDTVAIQYMKLVAEVHKDIAKLKEEYDFNINQATGKNGEYLLNNSSAIRKLIVFLATEDLSKITTGKVKNKSSALLQCAFQPQFVGSFIKRESGVNIKFLEPETRGAKVGYDDSSKTVYYDSNGVFNSNIGTMVQGTKDVNHILEGVVEAFKSVTEKDKNIKSSLKAQSGEVKDLVDLDNATKQNIQNILKDCLNKKGAKVTTDLIFGQKLSNLWNAFLNFFGLGKKVDKHNKIIPEAKKEGFKVLSNLLANANEGNSGKTEDYDIK